MNCEAADIIVRVMNVEHQQSGHACGLYACFGVLNKFFFFCCLLRF